MVHTGKEGHFGAPTIGQTVRQVTKIHGLLF